MTRQELEQLCQPQTPEEVLGELDNICDEHVKECGIDSEAIALKASTLILNKLIEEADMPATVKVRRMIW